MATSNRTSGHNMNNHKNQLWQAESGRDGDPAVVLFWGGIFTFHNNNLAWMCTETTSTTLMLILMLNINFRWQPARFSHSHTTIGPPCCLDEDRTMAAFRKQLQHLSNGINPWQWLKLWLSSAGAVYLLSGKLWVVTGNVLKMEAIL